jgi:hypothetical protein
MMMNSARQTSVPDIQRSFFTCCFSGLRGVREVAGTIVGRGAPANAAVRFLTPPVRPVKASAGERITRGANFD